MTAPADSDAGCAKSRTPKRRRRTRWWYFKWSVRAGVLLFVFVLLVFVKLDCMFYYPNDRVYDRPEELGLAYEEVRFPTKDGLTLAGWFFCARAEPRGTVVHFHGNAANISAHLGLVAWLPGEGYNLLMFDYRGYGQSEGRVSREGTVKDGHAAIDYALSRPEAQGRPLFAYGQSLGGAVAVVVAAQRPEVDAVVAESTFSGHRRIAAAHVQRAVRFEWLARAIAAAGISSGHDPVDVVDRISPRPLLVIVAGADEICFPELGRELYDAAAAPKELWEVPDAEHLGILADRYSELTERITEFFDRAAATATKP